MAISLQDLEVIEAENATIAAPGETLDPLAVVEAENAALFGAKSLTGRYDTNIFAPQAGLTPTAGVQPPWLPEYMRVGQELSKQNRPEALDRIHQETGLNPAQSMILLGASDEEFPHLDEGERQAKLKEVARRLGQRRAGEVISDLHVTDVTPFLRGWRANTYNWAKGRFDTAGADLFPMTEYAGGLNRDELQKIVDDYELEQIRGLTVGGEIAKGLVIMPAYMAEFGLTPELRALKAPVEATRLTRVASRVGSALTKAGFVTALTPGTVAESMANEAITGTSGPKAFLQAYRNAYIQNLSEMTGDAFPALAVPILKRLPLGSRLLKIMEAKALKRGVTSETFWDGIAKKASWNGFLEEYGEEELAVALEVVFDADDFGLGPNSTLAERMDAAIKQETDAWNVLVKSSVLAVPSGIHAAANALSRRGQAPVTQQTLQALAVQAKEAGHADLVDAAQQQAQPTTEPKQESLPVEQEPVPARESAPSMAGVLNQATVSGPGTGIEEGVRGPVEQVPGVAATPAEAAQGGPESAESVAGPGAKAGAAKEPWTMNKAEFFPMPANSSAVRSKEGRIYTGETHAQAYIALTEARDTFSDATEDTGWVVDGRYYPDTKENHLEPHARVLETAWQEGKPVPRSNIEEYKGQPWADKILAEMNAKAKAGPTKALAQSILSAVKNKDLVPADFVAGRADNQAVYDAASWLIDESDGWVRLPKTQQKKIKEIRAQAQKQGAIPPTPAPASGEKEVAPAQPTPLAASGGGKTSEWGANNTGVTLDEYNAIKAKLAKKGKLPGGRESGGAAVFSAEDWSDLLKIGRFHLEAGARAFADWSGRMIEDIGEAIRPHLEKLWSEVGEQDQTEPPEPPTPEQEKETIAPSAKLTSARQADLLTYNHDINRESVNSHQRQSWQDSLDSERARFAEEHPDIFIEKALVKKELLHAAEEAGLTKYLAKLRNELESVREQWKAALDPVVKDGLLAEMDRIEGSMARVIDALDIGGSDIGRALNIRKMLLNELLEIEYVKARAMKKKGKALTAQESARFEELTAKVNEQSARIVELQKQLEAEQAQQAVRKVRSKDRNMTAEQREARIKANYAKLRELIGAGC